jgi:hypothetical protein
MKKLLILILLAFSLNSFSAVVTHYVSSTATGSGNGLSTANPWTLAQLNSGSINPGDNILFKDGDTWRELLTIQSSGSLGSPITYGSYGTGAKPRFLGSNPATSWINISGNIWQATGTFTNPGADVNYPGTIYFVSNTDTTWGHVQKANTAALSMQYDWCWVANKIYVYSTTNPSTIYNSVEVTQRTQCISLNGKEHIVIDGLNVQFAGNTGIDGNYFNKRDLVIKNCSISYIGVKGGGAAYGVQANYSDMTVQYNNIHSTGRRGFSIGNAAANSLIENVIFEYNVFYDGYHTTGLDIQSNADGIEIQNVTIRHNYFYDSLNKQTTGAENYASSFIFLSEQSGFEDGVGTGDVRDFYIYNNLFENNSATGLSIDNAHGIYVYNNSFTSNNPSQTSSGMELGIGRTFGSLKLDSVVLKNNIFYTTQLHPLLYIDQLPTGKLISDYNIFYSTNSAYILAWQNVGICYPTQASFTNWKNVISQESNGLLADPLLNSNFTLRAGSPAKNAAINLGYGLDIGAIQSSTTITPTIDWPFSTVTYPNGLGAGQLTAVAKDGATIIEGTHFYSPGSGTVGNVPAISVKDNFTPADPLTYSSATKTVSIPINPQTVSLAFSGLTVTYTGNAQWPVLTSTPNVATSILLDGVSGGKINAGTYTATGGANDPNSTATPITATFTINKATAIINATNQTFNHDGLNHSIYSTTSPLGLNVTHTLGPISTIGTYTDTLKMVESNYQATPIVRTLTIITNTALIFISDSIKTYNGASQNVNVTSDYSYSLVGAPQINAGIYPNVIATINDGIHTGADTATLTILPKQVNLGWTKPANVAYGTQFVAGQLTAIADQAGLFTYNYSVGQLVPHGTTQLVATFTPSSPNYLGGTVITTITTFDTVPIDAPHILVTNGSNLIFDH